MIRPLRSLLGQRRAPSILPLDREAAFERARLRGARRAGPAQREIRRRIAGAAVGTVLVIFLIIASVATLELGQ